MDKKEILKEYTKREDKWLISKTLDKMEQCEKRNNICCTEFLDLYQKKILEDVLIRFKRSYLFYGGYEEANRTNCLIYPSNYSKQEVIQNYGEFIDMIRITLPKSLQGNYQHKDYLGGMMKLGVKREKTGDILYDSTGADLLVQKEITKYLMENLPYLTRFSKAKFQVMSVEEIRKIEIQKKKVTVIVSSLRIDTVIAELLGISRTKANELLMQKRVFINYQNETKGAKLIKEDDVIVVRGKGKYEFVQIEGNTRKNKFILYFLKYG